MPAFHHKKAAIWDMDGTLLYTLDDISAALNATLTAYNLPVHSASETLDGIGHGARYLCQWASGLEGAALDQFAADYRARAVSQNNPHTKPYPGILETLKRLSDAGIRHAIYTNKPQAWTEVLVKQFLSEAQFEVILGTHPGGFLKPSAQGIAFICQQMGIEISEAVMIGDSSVDAQTALNAGCDGICFDWGYGKKEEIAELGIPLIHTAEELVRMFAC